MSTSRNARRMMIYLGESDSWQGRSLYMSILETLRRSDIAGATVTRAIAGYGAHSRIRTNTIEVLSTDLPILISVVDSPENIERALTLVSPMVREGLITVEEIRIVKYTHRYLQPLPADAPVSQFMTRDVTSVEGTSPASEVVQLLLQKRLKAVPVLDSERRVIGIVTGSDLLEKAAMPVRLAVGQRLDSGELQSFVERVSHERAAADIMTTPVITAREDESLGHATQRIVVNHLTRMPVTDARNRLVGMISRLDILRAITGTRSEAPDREPLTHHGRTVGEIMSPVVPTVHVNDLLDQVLREILAAEIKRVVVLDEQERPIGIITDGDLVERVSGDVRRGVLAALAAKVVGTEVRPNGITARELMSENVLSVPPDTSIIDAIDLLLHEGRKRLLVLDESGRPQGLVDRQMLLAASLGI